MAFAKIKYSEREIRLLGILPKDGVKISTSALMEKFYHPDGLPFNGRKIIITMIRSLMRKSDYNHEDWRIHKTKRSGPNEMSFWKEPR